MLAGVASGLAGMAVANRINSILNYMTVDRISHENIGFGTCIGSVALLTTMLKQYMFLETLSVGSLVGGIATGILSFIRK